MYLSNTFGRSTSLWRRYLRHPPAYFVVHRLAGLRQVAWVLLLELDELAASDLQLHDVTESMLPRLEVRENLFAEVRAAMEEYDPGQEFLVLVWLPASMFFYRRKQLDAGTV